jgi:hypothetical protein
LAHERAATAQWCWQLMCLDMSSVALRDSVTYTLEPLI